MYVYAQCVYLLHCAWHRTEVLEIHETNVPSLVGHHLIKYVMDESNQINHQQQVEMIMSRYS